MEKRSPRSQRIAKKTEKLASMVTNIPEDGRLGRLLRTVRQVSQMRIPTYAANASFFIVWAVFPALVLILSIMRYAGLQVETLTDLLRGFVPEVLLPPIEKLIINTYANVSKAVVGVSALTALWSASRGVYGILTGLNAIYGVSEDRGYFYTRGISFVYMFFFIIVILLTLVLHVFGTTILGMIPETTNAFLNLVTGVIDFRFFLLLFLQTALFTAMFTALPNRRNRIRDSIPGALLASIGWLVFSEVFSIYVEHFSNYANLFGTVYALALCMLWLYFCLCIVFFGGALNRLLMLNRQSAA